MQILIRYLLRILTEEQLPTVYNVKNRTIRYLLVSSIFFLCCPLILFIILSIARLTYSEPTPATTETLDLTGQPTETKEVRQQQENGSGCTNLKKKEKRISELRYLATKRTYGIDKIYCFYTKWKTH